MEGKYRFSTSWWVDYKVSKALKRASRMNMKKEEPLWQSLLLLTILGAVGVLFLWMLV